MASASRKNHQMKTGVVRGNPDERKRPASLDRGPGNVKPFAPGEKDFDPKPAPPRKFDGSA